MSRVMKPAVEAVPIAVGLSSQKLSRFLPVALPVVAALLLIGMRMQFGANGFLNDGAMIVLALICYITASLLFGTYWFSHQESLQRWALWVAGSGLCFNLASWGMRWIEAGDREGWIRWFFGYIPFANLYDLSIAFTAGAALATMAVCVNKQNRIIGALSMPLSSLIVTLAFFLGREFINLPPILDSYWRPIHVGVASLSYGVCLVSFSIAVLYLLKDGIKIEAMGIFVALFSVCVFATLNKFSVLTSGSYALATMLPRGDGSGTPLPLRVDLPWVGPLMLACAAVSAGVMIFYYSYVKTGNTSHQKTGHLLMRSALVFQLVIIGVLVFQIKTLANLTGRINPAQLPHFGEWLAGEQAAQATPAQLSAFASQWIQERGSALYLSPNANPVEFSSVITLAVLTLFIVLFTWKPERALAALPSAEALDHLVYKTVSFAVPGLALLLITGAVWANESWGRYWGWDAKEVGALVAFLAYTAYLHTRITHGWTGRRSAYFALLGFLFIIFTYLGVSYLLPGLHSYA